MFKIPKSIQIVLNKLKRMIGVTSQDKELVAGLSDLSNSLGAAISGVEGDFLDLGQKFQIIFSKTEELKGLVSKTSAFSGNKNDGSGIAGVGEFARKSLQTLTGYQGDIQSNLKILNSGSDYLQLLSNMCANTDKVSLLLNVIALNIAIESNRTAESREMFMVFVTEVKDISEQISHVSKELYYDSKFIREKQLQYQQDISGHLCQLQNLTRKADKVVNQSVETIENIMEKSLEALGRASDCSNDINSMVSSIVMGMQFHDIVRQQIEHVVIAIEEAIRLYTTFEADTGDSEQKVMNQIYSILMIQNAQIKSTIGEIDTVYKNILNAFQGIEAKVAELLSCVSYSTSERSGEDDDGDLFSILLSGFANLNKLLGDAYHLKRSMNEVAEEASTATEGLLKHVDHVQRISLDLHRKALNAIIKAAHLGDMGRALEVFAHEVTTASNESNTFADKVVDHIESIATLTSQMLTTSDIKDNDETLNLSHTTSVDRISTSYDDFLENTTTTRNMSTALEQSITEAKSSLSFISEFSDALKIQLNTSEEILSKINMKNEFSPVMTDITDTSDRYTMESERLVHLSLFGDTDSEGDVEVKEDTPEEADVDIELFNEPSVDSHESPTTKIIGKEPLQDLPPEDSIAMNDNPSSDKADKSDDEFDDNIELF